MVTGFVLIACVSHALAGSWTETDYATQDCSGQGVSTRIEENKWGNIKAAGTRRRQRCHGANGVPVSYDMRCDGGSTSVFKVSAGAHCQFLVKREDLYEYFECGEFEKYKRGMCARNRLGNGMSGSIRITSGSYSGPGNPCSCSLPSGGGGGGGGEGGASANGAWMPANVSSWTGPLVALGAAYAADL
eukprot:TRINITY_DN4548_c0_g1_i2.p1 TRINITY_DN4548_c0_g1~~TRINITY_DN4548_c0_g1_i2.p1  ORF type:complete len:214 (+),score=9.14 TRINITY_DN4548_c0_g1_i2:81-644(+)